MGLLTPWFLTGLTLIAVPVFVHLLRKHVTTPRTVSSLMFFERGIQSSTRHRRLRHLLLFSLRVLLITLIVLAFANPFIHRPPKAQNTLLLVALDNSFSMRAGNRFTDAKQGALNLLASRSQAQRSQIIALGDPLQILTQPVSDSPQRKSAIDSLQVGDGHGSYAELVRSVRALSETWNGPIELHLFSDMQRTAMPDNFAEVVLPAKVRLILHNAAENIKAPNWTIENIDAPTEAADPNDPSASRVQAVVAGFSTPEADKTVTLLVNGKVSATRTVHIPADGRTPVEFGPVNVAHGFNRCELRIEGNDSLVADNTGRFVIHRADPQRILFVHNAADLRSPIYFGAALNAATKGAFILQPMAPEQVSEIDPKRFSFTVLSDTTALPSTFEHALEQYVSRGGNLFIALGLSAAQHTHIPLWAGAAPRDRRFGEPTPAAIGRVDFTFPALQQEKPSPDNGGWGSAKVFYAASVDPSGAHVIAQLNDGTPLLLERHVGEGRVLLFTSGFDNLTNDLPLFPVFVSFIDKTTRYLSGTEQQSGSHIVNTSLQLRSSANSSQNLSSTAEIIDPDGHRALSLDEAKNISAFQLTRTGFYQIHLPDGKDSVIGVNPDPKESDLTPIPPQMLDLWSGSNTSAPKEEVAASSTIKSQDTSLWWYVMLAAFVVALAEIFLSNRYLGIRQEEL